MKTHEEKLAVLRDLGELQGEMAQKAAVYRTQDKPELYMRFERASYAAVNARLFMQAALMAEREASASEVADKPWDGRSSTLRNEQHTGVKRT